MPIHPSAIISKKAKLGKDVFIGPYSIIGDDVVIGDGTRIGSFCVIDGNTSLGKNCQVYTGAVIGSPPQDLKYKGAKSLLVIGDNNIIREYTTFNPGTDEGGKTVIGNNNLFMAYVHIAHDCTVGNNCVLANNGTLAGHVTVEDNVVVGGFGAAHQFVRLGKLAIVGGCSKAIQDVPPFSSCDGHPARLYGLNLIGLERYGVPKESIRQLKHVFKILFNSGLIIKNAIERVKQEIPSDKDVDYLINFINNSSRGTIRSCRSK